MNVSQFSVACPACHSLEIAYSCEPECCFNHVCSDCLTSFQLTSADLGDSLPKQRLTHEEKDSCAPTVRCARCQGLDIWAAPENNGALICAKCFARLELVIT